MSAISDVIASFEVTGFRPTGEQVQIVARIGRPYQGAAEGAGEWACPVELTPLYPDLPDIRGIDSFHAVWLAGSLVLKLLKHFKASGGTLLNADGSEFPLEDYAAGLGS